MKPSTTSLWSSVMTSTCDGDKSTNSKKEPQDYKMQSHQIKGSNYYTTYHIGYGPEAGTNPTRGGIYRAPCIQSTAVSLCGYQETDAILGTAKLCVDVKEMSAWWISAACGVQSVQRQQQQKLSLTFRADFFWLAFRLFYLIRSHGASFTFPLNIQPTWNSCWWSHRV